MFSGKARPLKVFLFSFDCPRQALTRKTINKKVRCFMAFKQKIKKDVQYELKRNFDE